MYNKQVVFGREERKGERRGPNYKKYGLTLTNSESNEKNNDESKSQKNIIGSESESKSQKDEKKK